MSNINPFNITKAVDYSDEEINRYWVDIPGGNGFADLLKPKSPMPMIILGGKGSGKTHIMRYFSFNLQKIRYKDKLKESLADDGYIGVFMRCSGLNSGKFSGDNQTNEAWKNIFSYYLELWFSQLVLKITEEIISTESNLKELEQTICEETIKLFDCNLEVQPSTISDLKHFLHKLQKQVDYEVNNCAITGEKISNMRILISPGGIIFGLPRILETVIPVLKNIQFIYLIDEFENLFEYQQRYINTLIREREAPVSFRIGARWYGIKTINTFSGNEDLKEGSEYEKQIIDQLLRDRQVDYEKFAKKICVSRLIEAGFAVNENEGRSINSFFEEFELGRFFEKLKKKEYRDRYSYFTSLRNNLPSKISEIEQEEIINNLSYSNNPLLERTNVFLFYRSWKEGIDLIAASRKIKEECVIYDQYQSKASSQHLKILSKFKSDIIDDLSRETREDLPYTGFDKLVKMSAGIPRLLLIMLKHVFRWSTYNGETPFRDRPITSESQHNGLEDAIKWFIDDARLPGPSGKSISNAIDRIGKLLQEIRFSNLPPECSLSSFSINELDISDAIQKSLDYLEQYSYIVKVNSRREKNSPVHRVTYQINGLIAPNWELSIYRRGILPLTKKEVTAIFASQEEDNFIAVRNERLTRYNAPFKNEKQSNNLKTEKLTNKPSLPPLLFE